MAFVTRMAAEAEEAYRSAIAVPTTAPDPQSLAKALNNLGALLYEQGRNAEVLPLYQQALSLAEKEFGAESGMTTIYLANLGELYRRTGQWTEAIAAARRAPAIREKLFGPSDPRLATNLNGLACIYIDLGRHSEGEEFVTRALQI